MTCKPVISVLRVPGFADRAMRLLLMTSIARAFIAMKIGVEKVGDIIIIPPPTQENYGDTDDIVIVIDLGPIQADSRTVMENILYRVKEIFPKSIVQVTLRKSDDRYMVL